LGGLTTGANNVGIGAQAGLGITGGGNNVAIGVGTLQFNNVSDVFALGVQAGQSSTANSCMYFGINAGQNNSEANDLIFGGDNSAFAVARVFFGGNNYTANATTYPVQITGSAGSGSNSGGAATTFGGGQSTGNANGGQLILAVSLPGSSGSTLNTLSNVFTISGANGNVGMAKIVSATNGFYFPSNALSVWPSAPGTPGDSYIGNSNGWIYMLCSKQGSSSWSKTNLIATP
jgi:hypothetical protein